MTNENNLERCGTDLKMHMIQEKNLDDTDYEEFGDLVNFNEDSGFEIGFLPDINNFS